MQGKDDTCTKYHIKHSLFPHIYNQWHEQSTVQNTCDVKKKRKKLIPRPERLSTLKKLFFDRCKIGKTSGIRLETGGMKIKLHRFPGENDYKEKQGYCPYSLGSRNGKSL